MMARRDSAARARAAFGGLLRTIAVLAPALTIAAAPAAAQLPTPTFTNTSLPSRTATFTSTSVPPTRTPTRTFTSTSVPAAPTASPTVTATIGFGLSIGDAVILEGNDGTRAAVFEVRLRGPRTHPVRVNARTFDGTAAAASDYDALGVTLVFTAFENRKTVAVMVRGDKTREPAETFGVALSGAVGAPLGDAVGVGTILDDDGLGVGVPELVPADPVAAPGELTTLTLRWVHPERWRSLDTVDLRLVDGARPVLWTRFEEAAGTFAVCDDAGQCGPGVPPGTGDPIRGAATTFHPAESAVEGSGPTGPSVDLVVAFVLHPSLAGRVLRVETAASEDSGAQQGFLPIAYLVIDGSPNAGAGDDDGCAIHAPRGGGDGGLAFAALGLLALIALRMPWAPRRGGGAAGLILLALSPAGASAQFCLSQADCEDGLFCTDDICLGVCVRTARGCDDFNQCTDDRCSEGANRCINTIAVDRRCEDFNIFTGNDRCTAQGRCEGVVCAGCALQCRDNNDCSSGFRCRRSDGACVDAGAGRPSSTATASRTRTRTSTRTRTRSATATRTRTATATGTHTRGATATPSSSATPFASPTPSVSPTPPPTASTVPTPSNGVNATATPTTDPSASPTPTPTPAPTASATITVMGVFPTPTVTPSPPAGGCPGDCDGDAAVGVNEIVLGVNIASGTLPIEACPSLDSNGSAAVDIAELVAAVRAALLGC